MADYDVIVIGGGVNGLTSAAYLGRAGLKVLVLEGRGECGAHCDTNEPGIPGFLHNLHATWLITAMSPAMGELQLEKYGLELRGTDFVYAKTFKDGKNVLMGTNPMDTLKNWKKLSAKDAAFLEKSMMAMMPRMDKLTQLVHRFLFTAPSWEMEKEMIRFNEEITKEVGTDLRFEDIWQMNGFQVTDVMYESEYIRTMLQSLAWIGALPPIHRTVGSAGTAVLGPQHGTLLTVHQAKGGSHALTHSLVKAAKSYGVKILPCCPVDKILLENGKAAGVKLADYAVYPGETFTAKKIVSNLTLVPTFIDLIGENGIGGAMASKISKFSYDEQNLFGVYYALDGAPQFASADFDEGIQRCFMGYFGGEDSSEMMRFNANLVSGVIHEEVIANWFVPTLADPTQAPPGCHTSFVWFDVPPAPVRWRKGPLKGIESWDAIKDELADQVTDTYERYAPGFKKLVKDRILYTPLDMQKNNPSAVKGNWVGGSVIPEQFFMNRPLPGILQGGGARTFLPGLYLSNSIHPFGATWLASGYIAACEVAEDLGVRNQAWWNEQACSWYAANMNRIPLNLGVPPK